MQEPEYEPGDKNRWVHRWASLAMYFLMIYMLYHFLSDRQARKISLFLLIPTIYIWFPGIDFIRESAIENMDFTSMRKTAWIILIGIPLFLVIWNYPV
jgi:hypothetical protein